MVLTSRGGTTYFVPEGGDDGGAGGGDGGYDESEAAAMELMQPVALTGPTPEHQSRSVQSMFLQPDLVERYERRTLISMQRVGPDDPRHKELPPRYHSIQPLDDPSVRRDTAGSLGYPSALYKVVDSKNGVTYALRRIDNTRATHAIAKATVDMWRRKHPHHANVVGFRDAFVSQRALFFVHDYHPGAESVAAQFLDYKKSQNSGGLVPEAALWSIICQILSALRSIHRAELAARLIEPSRILAIDGRVLVGCTGLLDVLECESKKSVADMQAVRGGEGQKEGGGGGRRWEGRKELRLAFPFLLALPAGLVSSS